MKTQFETITLPITLTGAFRVVSLGLVTLLCACPPGTDDASSGTETAMTISASSGDEAGVTTSDTVTPTTSSATTTNPEPMTSSTGEMGESGGGEAGTTGDSSNCGDGIVDVEEECDDGFDCDDGSSCLDDDDCGEIGDGKCLPRDTDECSNECWSPLLAFVTYKVYFGGELGNTTGADEECNLEANLAKYKGEYKAWVADDLNAPKFSFDPSIKAWFVTTGPDHLPVAKGYEGLMKGELVNTINFNQYGLSVGTTSVWTNVTKDGDRGEFKFHCSNWNKSEPKFNGATGTSQKVLNVNTWTQDLVKPCNIQLPIYCFEMRHEQQEERK